MNNLPSKEQAHKLLNEYVRDNYQRLHAEMVAEGLEAYATKFEEDKQLWYITGLLHDLDYDQFPEEHVTKEIQWFKEWNYPEELIHAVSAHYWSKTNELPKTKLAAALIATDELAGFLYAYSLMRPNGFEGMEASSVKKKFKDKTFAAKIDRSEILFGIEKLTVDFNEHVSFLINVYKDKSFKLS